MPTRCSASPRARARTSSFISPGCPGVRRSLDEPARYVRANVVATQNVLDAFAREQRRCRSSSRAAVRPTATTRRRRSTNPRRATRRRARTPRRSAPANCSVGRGRAELRRADHDRAAVHRVRPAPAARSRDPQVRDGDAARQGDHRSSATARWRATSRTSAISCAASRPLRTSERASASSTSATPRR